MKYTSFWLLLLLISQIFTQIIKTQLRSSTEPITIDQLQFQKAFQHLQQQQLQQSDEGQGQKNQQNTNYQYEDMVKEQYGQDFQFNDQRDNLKEKENNQQFRVDQSDPGVDQILKQYFQQFKQKYRKNYNQDEQSLRYQTFVFNFKFINQHNENEKNPNFKLTLNGFSDLIHTQFRSKYLMTPIKKELRQIQTKNQGSVSTEISDLLLQRIKPIDWRRVIRFGPIKDQGECSACYAFAVLGAIQLNVAFRKRMLQPSFSQQQIVDCCGENGFKCNGCTSGQLAPTLDYLSTRGIPLTEKYPYKQKIQDCPEQFVGYEVLYRKKPYQQFEGVSKLISNLKKGPIAVAADASNEKWKFYQGGIFSECNYSDFQFNHALVIIGIERDGTWLARNSWGKEWGLQGYMRLAGGNSCGVAQYAFLPIIT